MNDSNPQTDIRQLFASFGPPKRETCYGRVTDEEYERRATVDRAKAQARRDCTLCDSAGYRNMYLCDHVNHDAKRRNHLRVVPSGDE